MTVKDYFRFTGVPLYMHFMGWYGPDAVQHPKVNYLSDNPTVVARQLSEIKRWGFDGVILDWYGDGAKYRRINRTAALLLDICADLNLTFAVSIDSGAMPEKGATAELRALIDYANAFFTPSPHYAVDAKGRSLIFEFGMETLAEKIDWPTIVGAYPQCAFIHRNLGGFATPGAGAYGWIDSGLPYLVDFYAKARVPSVTQQCYGSIFKGFDNRKLKPDGTLVVPDTAVWPNRAVRIIPENAGQTFLDTVELTNKFHEAGGNLAGVICNTYNDWPEGTAVEGGIDAGLKVTLSGNKNAVSATGVITKAMFKGIPTL